MTFVSKYERVNAELRQAHARRDREGLTPEHAAATAGLADAGHDDGEPDDEVAAVCEPDSVKVFRDAYQVPAEYPEPIRVSPEDFRRGPIRVGREALSPGDDCA